MPRKNRSPQITRRPFPQKDCGSKRRLQSARHAEAQAELQMLEQPRLQLATYHCAECNGWHLTSVKPNNVP